MSPQSLSYVIVDAFTSESFKGNSCAVVVLEQPLPGGDPILQLIAREFNLSETAFLIPLPEKNTSDLRTFGLRWFTPTVEVKLCGHATLGSARALFADTKQVPEGVTTIEFETLSGTLVAKRLSTGKIELSFPSSIARELSQDEEHLMRSMTVAAIGEKVQILDICRGDGDGFEHRIIAEIDPAVDLKKLDVNIDALKLVPQCSLCITSRGSGSTHFLSRYFAPAFGIPEDPVTGSLHCVLAPYWTKKLNMNAGDVLFAKQVSAREGDLEVVWDEEKGKTLLRGDAKISAKGELYL